MTHHELTDPAGSNGDHRGRARTYRTIAGMASLLLMSALIVTTSRAAFTAQTDNTSNSFSTGSVVLVDDDTGSSLFSVTAMGPGDSVTSCINVTYNGTLDPGPVNLYVPSYTESVASFADFINVTVDEGTLATGGAATDCTGFVSDDGGTAEYSGDLTSFPATYALGVGDWDPDGSGPGQVKSYQVTLELDSSAGNSEQNQSITALNFTWEVQS